MTMKTLAFALALSLAPTLASAQTPPPASRPAPHVYRATAEVHIDGRVPRPWTWVQSRSQLHYSPAETRRSFAPTVVSAVRRSPF